MYCNIDIILFAEDKEEGRAGGGGGGGGGLFTWTVLEIPVLVLCNTRG